MQITIEELYNFFNDHPEEINNLEVETQYGFYKIQGCEITTYNSKIIQIKTSSNKIIETSPDHLLLMELNGVEDWIKVSCLKIGNYIKTKHGYEKIIEKNILDFRENLYDIQVKDVKEFYANEIVSHNSTFLDSLTFSLFGKPFRNIPKPLLINSINKKNLLTEIEFSKGSKHYKVIRGMKPNIFEVYCNGEKYHENANVKDAQKEFEENILGMNYRSFTQVVILGSSNFTPFMQLPAQQRRILIEDLLDIRIFSVMNSILKNYVAENSENIRTNITNKNITKERIDNQIKIIENIKENKNKNLGNLQGKIESCQKEIEKRNEKIENIKEECVHLNKKIESNSYVIEKYHKLQQYDYELKKKERNVQNNVNFYTKNSHCSSCGQDIQESFREKK